MGIWFASMLRGIGNSLDCPWNHARPPTRSPMRCPPECRHLTPSRKLASLSEWVVRHPYWCLLAFAAILATQISPHWFAMPDSLPYLSMARSLAHGEGLRNLGREHWIYAPGYSVLVAPAFWVSDRPFLVLSATQWALGIIYMLGVYAWTRLIRPESAIWVAALSVLGAAFWVVCRQTLSDAAFMATMAWTAWCCARMRSASSARSLMLWAIPTLMGLAALPIIRPAGVCLAAGFGVMMLLRVQRDRTATRWVALGIAAAIATVALSGLVLLISRELTTARAGNAPTNVGGFLAQLKSFSDTWISSIRLRITDTGRVLIPGMFKAYSTRDTWLDPNLLLYVPITFMAIVGWFRVTVRTPDALMLAVPFYVALHLLWGLDQGARYLVPMLPVLWIALWEVTNRWPEVRRIGAVLLIVAHLGVTLGYWVSRELPRGRAMAATEVVGDDMAGHIRTRPGAVVCDTEAKMAGYWVSFVLDRPVDERRISLDAEVPGDWLIVGVEMPVPPAFQVVHEAGSYRLLERSGRGPSP